MSLSANNQCLASDFVDLKARVKAEMQRRCRNGSLTSYAGTDYDYTIVPNAKEQMLVEHVNKILIPMNAINDSGMSEKAIGDQAVAMDTIDAKLTVYEAETMRGSSSCNASCSGLCTSGCWNSCSGCGGCGGCDGTCSGGCDDTCSGQCGSLCTGTCSGSCGNCGGCGSSCTGSSTDCSNCSGTCKTSAS